MNFSAVNMASGKKKIQRNAGAGVTRPLADDNLQSFCNVAQFPAFEGFRSSSPGCVAGGVRVSGKFMKSCANNVHKRQ